jgi:TonB family protein
MLVSVIPGSCAPRACRRGDDCVKRAVALRRPARQKGGSIRARMTPPLHIDTLDAAAAPTSAGAPAFAAAAAGSALAHAGLLIALMLQSAPATSGFGETVIDVAIIVGAPTDREDIRSGIVSPAAPALDSTPPGSAEEPVAASGSDDIRDDRLSMPPAVEAATAEPQNSPADIGEAPRADLALAIDPPAPAEPREAPVANAPQADASVAAESQTSPADIDDAPPAPRAELALAIGRNAPAEPAETPAAPSPPPLQDEPPPALAAPKPRPDAPPRATSAKRPAPPRLAAPPADPRQTQPPRPPAPRAEPAPVRQAALAPAARAGATASDAAPRGADVAAYRGLVAARIAAAKRYPAGARERGESGRPVLAFTLTPTGAVAGATIARSSGHAELDAETLAMLRRAAPFPKPPAGAPRSFSIGVSFDLR